MLFEKRIILVNIQASLYGRKYKTKKATSFNFIKQIKPYI